MKQSEREISLGKEIRWKAALNTTSPKTNYPPPYYFLTFLCVTHSLGEKILS